MARITLYLPAKLHERLDELPDDLSLSAIFQERLEAELATLDEADPARNGTD